MKSNRVMEVRDLRDGGFLWIDKAALELICRKLDNRAVTVYAWLCYYADSKAQNCFPSVATLSKKCKASTRTVKRKIKDLEDLKVIFVERNKGRHNVYKLLNITGKQEKRSSDTGVTSVGDVTTEGTPVSPPVVTPQTHEQELVYQESFIESTAAFSEEKIQELKALCKDILPAINLYQFIQSFKNDRGYPPPVDVMIKLCQRFKKDKHKIKNVWGWFKRTVDAESAQHFAQANIKEHEQLKNEPAMVGHIFAQMMGAQIKDLGPFGGGRVARVGRGAACQ